MEKFKSSKNNGLSDTLKQRFCKDMKVSIGIFTEPYFTNRIKLLNKYNEWKAFEKLVIERFDGKSKAFLDEYDSVRDKVINFIQETEAFKELNSADMSKYAVRTCIRQSDVYKETNIGKTFISIDMKKANFSSLVAFSLHEEKQFFNSNNNYDWTEFISQFTDIEHIKNSKYIRQVIFGKCNTNRIMTYEKYLMNNVLNMLIVQEHIKLEAVYSLCNDEIIIDTDKLSKEFKIDEIIKSLKQLNLPLKIEVYTLGRILGTDAFCKHITREDNTEADKLEFKCLNALEAPFVYRKIVYNEDIQEEDLYFSFNGKLAKLIDKPEIELTYESR